LRRIKTVIEKVGKRWNRGRRKEYGEKMKEIKGQQKD